MSRTKLEEMAKVWVAKHFWADIPHKVPEVAFIDGARALAEAFKEWCSKNAHYYGEIGNSHMVRDYKVARMEMISFMQEICTDRELSAEAKGEADNEADLYAEYQSEPWRFKQTKAPENE